MRFIPLNKKVEPQSRGFLFKKMTNVKRKRNKKKTKFASKTNASKIVSFIFHKNHIKYIIRKSKFNLINFIRKYKQTPHGSTIIQTRRKGANCHEKSE